MNNNKVTLMFHRDFHLYLCLNDGCHCKFHRSFDTQQQLGDGWRSHCNYKIHANRYIAVLYDAQLLHNLPLMYIIQFQEFFLHSFVSPFLIIESDIHHSQRLPATLLGLCRQNLLRKSMYVFLKRFWKNMNNFQK